MKTLTFVQDCITSNEAFFKLTRLQKYLQCREQKPIRPNFINNQAEGPLALFSKALTPLPTKKTYFPFNKLEYKCHENRGYI